MKIMQKRRYVKGFTLVEVFLVIAILLIATTIAVPIYGNLILTGQRKEAVTRVISNLRLARAYSGAGKRKASYGVYFDVESQRERMVLYLGDSYFTRESVYDQEFVFGKGISVNTTYLNNDINFPRDLGSEIAGELKLKTEDVFATLIINELGLVKQAYE